MGYSISLRIRSASRPSIDVIAQKTNLRLLLRHARFSKRERIGHVGPGLSLQLYIRKDKVVEALAMLFGAELQIAAQREFQSVGIDIEPAEPLAPDLLGIVATAKERDRIDDDPFHGRATWQWPVSFVRADEIRDAPGRIAAAIGATARFHQR